MAEVCVIGAGPAGSIFATRMAQLGHQVHLIERQRFPRAHLGESCFSERNRVLQRGCSLLGIALLDFQGGMDA